MYRNFSSSRDYCRKSLRLVDKITKCKHHIEFISIYLREKKVPKGFRLKFHSGVDCPDYFSKTLSKASSKLMIKRRTFYRRELDSSVAAYNAIWSALEEDFPNYSKTLRDECDFKMGKLATLLSFRRSKKYSRDKLVLNNQTKEKELVSKIMEGNMSNTRISEGLKSLCSNGPSFVPMPYNVNSREILQNLSNFRNKIRWRSFFAKRSENDESNDSNTETEHPDTPPKIKKLTKQAPKSSFPEIETFLENVERDIYEDCRNKKWVRDNLTSDERLALNTWRKEVLFNPDSDLVMRLQDKGLLSWINRLISLRLNSKFQRATL